MFALNFILQLLALERPPLLELEQGLACDDYTLETVLVHPAIFVAIRLNNEIVVNYLIDNIKDMLECSFSNTSSPESTSAFQSLSLMNDRITRALIASNEFHQMALDMISKDLDPSVIGRLSDLTTLIIRSSQPGSIDCCNFLLQMLKFIDNTGVLEMFVNVLDDSIEFQLAQQWLLNHDFAGVILKELESIPLEEIETGHLSYGSGCRCLGLFRIIEAGNKNHIMIRSFRTAKIVKCLFRDVRFPWFVEDARWRAIMAVCDDAGRNICSDYMDFGKRVLEHADDGVHQYHTYVIDYLAQMLPESYDADVFRRMITLLETYPETSLLHRSISNYVKLALRNKCLELAEIKVFVTFLCQQTVANHCGNIHASAMELLEMCMNYWKKHKRVKKEIFKCVDGLRDRMRKEFLPYFKLRDTEYGKKEGFLKRIFKIGSRDNLQAMSAAPTL